MLFIFIYSIYLNGIPYTYLIVVYLTMSELFHKDKGLWDFISRRPQIYLSEYEL